MLTGGLSRQPYYLGSSEAERVLAEVRDRNESLSAIKGLGRIKYTSNSRTQSARLAWMAAEPGKIRLLAYDLTRQPILRIIGNGETVDLWSYQDEGGKKGTYAETSLQLYLGLPVKVSDIYALLAGRLPMRGYVHYTLSKLTEEGHFVLTFYDGSGNTVEKVFLDGDHKTVRKATFFADRQKKIMQIRFDDHRQVGPYLLPFQILISDLSGGLIELRVERYWPDSAVPETAFRFSAP